MASTPRTMVQHPLTPTILTEIGALEASPLPEDGFDAAGPWTQRFRVWTCYGHREAGNVDQGELILERSATEEGRFSLAVTQTLRMDPKRDECDHVIEASIQCREDRLATPVSWSLTSRFVGGKPGQEPSDMDHTESAELLGKRLRVEAGGRTHTRGVSREFTADWCLFEAVHRSTPADLRPLEFDFLEGLTAWKPGQRLSYRGRLPVDWAGDRLELECLQQLGMGVWPYEYWLDDAGRLVMAITGCRAYVLDPRKGRG